MRNYYYCEGNGAVYTENEKKNSWWPGSRFFLIGKYSKRADAEKAWDNKNGLYFPIMPVERRA